MATARKKSAAKKKGRSSGGKPGRTDSSTEDLQKPPYACNVRDICEYLTKLNAWLTWFIADYEKLRVAVCNVERQAFNGTGDPAKRFCSNGSTNQPAKPTQPPQWF